MLKEILKDLDSKKKTVRAAAIERARALPLDTLLELILADNKRLAYTSKYEHAKVLAFFVLLMMLITIVSMRWASFLVTKGILLGWLAFLMGAPILLPFTISLRSRQGLASLLADTEDPAFLPHLLSLLAITSYNGGINVYKVLQRLLPKCSRQHAAVLTKNQREQVCTPLSFMCKAQWRNAKKWDGGFQTALCVLKCLEQIGEATEYDLVCRLATIKVRTERDRQIQQAAQECLPFLEIRRDEQRQAQTLLRPSDNTTADKPGTLLRPASASPVETPTEQLLRSIE